MAEVELLHNKGIPGGYPSLDSDGIIPSRQLPSTFSDADKNYVHDQNVASAIWNINHDLGKFVAITIVDSALTEVIGDITYTDSNNVIVTFSASFSGKAYLN